MKFLNFFEKKQSVFGLHLNGTALKFIQFQAAGSKQKIVGFSNVTMPPNLISNEDIIDHKGLVRLIQQSLMHPQSGRITTNRVVFSIPESKSFVRVIRMNTMSEQELENAVLFEAEAYIPLPMDQVYFDWQILRHDTGGMDVLLIASPKEFVNKYIDVFEAANLKIVAIEVESQSVVRALVPKDNVSNLLIADLDAYKTALVMVVQGNLQFTSSIPIAGNVFTDRIAQGLGIPADKAEAIKREYGVANSEAYPNMESYLLPAVNDLAAEIKNILKFHYEHSKEKVTQLLLSGGSAKLKHMDEFLIKALTDIPEFQVKVADPWQNLALANPAALSSYEALSYTTAIGLAMRGVSES
jgi:type IV pilus assembly protein PilM